MLFDVMFDIILTHKWYLVYLTNVKNEFVNQTFDYLVHVRW